METGICNLDYLKFKYLRSTDRCLPCFNMLFELSTLNNMLQF